MRGQTEFQEPRGSEELSGPPSQEGFGLVCCQAGVALSRQVCWWLEEWLLAPGFLSGAVSREVTFLLRWSSRLSVCPKAFSHAL